MISQGIRKQKEKDMTETQFSSNLDDLCAVVNACMRVATNVANQYREKYGSSIYVDDVNITLSGPPNLQGDTRAVLSFNKSGMQPINITFNIHDSMLSFTVEKPANETKEAKNN